MAVSPTSNLQLVRNQSEHDASKIALINQEMVDIDSVIGGIVVLSVAGAANVTLTRAQALNRALKFTGVLTGNIIIYLPVIANLALSPVTTTIGAARDYLIWNATTGAFTLTIKTSAVGSVGAAVTTAKKVYVFHDGTDVYKATTEV